MELGGDIISTGLQVEVFCVGTQCSVVVGYQSFGDPCCLHLVKWWFSSTTLDRITTQKTSIWNITVKTSKFLSPQYVQLLYHH